MAGPSKMIYQITHNLVTTKESILKDSIINLLAITASLLTTA